MKYFVKYLLTIQLWRITKHICLYVFHPGRHEIHSVLMRKNKVVKMCKKLEIFGIGTRLILSRVRSITQSGYWNLARAINCHDIYTADILCRTDRIEAFQYGYLCSSLIRRTLPIATRCDSGSPTGGSPPNMVVYLYRQLPIFCPYKHQAPVAPGVPVGGSSGVRNCCLVKRSLPCLPRRVFSENPPGHSIISELWFSRVLPIWNERQTSNPNLLPTLLH